MCLIAFAIGASRRWPLVIAANRDEFLDRPTLPLARWQTPNGHDIISGRDLRAGGAWFGITPAGRVAFLTNVREPGVSPGPRSRGELVLAWLQSSCNADQFAAGFGRSVTDFAGFNLVIGDFAGGTWTWLSNRGGPAHGARPGWQMRHLPPGVYGLSNAALDSPWPKTVQLKSALRDLLDQPVDSSAIEIALWSALARSDRAAGKALPETGVSREVEEALSSAFVEFPDHGYGTRSSTMLVAERMSAPAPSAQVRMMEREHLRRMPGQPWQLRSESLQWPPPLHAPADSQPVKAS
jgi:uncharacterized protein with NRDE domain